MKKLIAAGPLLSSIVICFAPSSASGWCISDNACTVASVCNFVVEGKISYLDVPVFLLIIYTLPLLYLIYHLWWKIITKFKKALTGTLAVLLPAHSSRIHIFSSQFNLLMYLLALIREY
jgi:hypothetical protein